MARGGGRDIDVAISGRSRVARGRGRLVSRTCSQACRLQRSGPVLRVALVLVVLGAGGCLYTGPINDRPRAGIEKQSPGPYHDPGERIDFSAGKSSDPEDGGSLRAVWSAYSCPSEASCTPIGTREERGIHEVFSVAVPEADHSAIQVQLDVRDRSGAQSRDIMRVEIGNRAPTFRLEVVQGGQAPGTTDTFVVTVPVEITVSNLVDPDGDETTLTWSLADRPVGSDPNDVEWRPLGGGATYELIPDVAGRWRVDVTATDGLEQGTTTVMEQILVDQDQPPCIEIASPAAPAPGRFALRRDDGPRSFALLSVRDDLDPYPRPVSSSPHLGDASFRWFLAGPQSGGELVPVAGAAGAELAIDPAHYAPGDIVELRVEAADRVARELPCSAAQQTCSIGGDGCLQRITWEVEIR
jgi:hypothetical protein